MLRPVVETNEYAGILDWIKEHIFGIPPKEVQEAKTRQMLASAHRRGLLIGAGLGLLAGYLIFKAGKTEKQLKQA